MVGLWFVIGEGMTDDPEATLRRIVDTAQGLRLDAMNAGFGMLGYLLEMALHEARAEMGRRGLPLEKPPPDGNVVKLR
jgi:hypothetical protein